MSFGPVLVGGFPTGVFMQRIAAIFIGLLSAAAWAQGPPPGSPGITQDGSITRWLLLGPFKTGMGCGPTVDQMRLDFLTDGEIFADVWTPRHGDRVRSDCRGLAACLEWDCDQAKLGDPDLVCGGTEDARVVLWDSPRADGFIDLNNFWGSSRNSDPPGGGTSESVMGYAWTYLRNKTGQPLRVVLGHSSDDSFRVLLNFREVPGTPLVACRWWEPTKVDQEHLGPLELDPGVNVLMTETWEGWGDWGFRFHLLHAGTLTPLTTAEVEVTEEPPPPPAVIARRVLPAGFSAGQKIQVSIDLRIADPPPPEVEVRERIPYTWHALDPSASGAIEVDGTGRETVVWKLSGLKPGTVALSYRLQVPNPFADVSFQKSVVLAGSKEFKIFGHGAVRGGTAANVAEALSVAIRQPTRRCSGEDPGTPAQGDDYLAGGERLSELTAVPIAGDAIAPDFGGDSPSPGPLEPPSLVWVPRAAQPGGWFSLGPCTDCLTYLAFYVVNPTAETLRVRVGAASDDGCQVLVDGREVLNVSVPRQSGGAAIQDHGPLFDLAPGKHLVLQKVFQGCGGHDSALRFEDEDENPLVILPTTLDPAADPAYVPPAAAVLRRLPAGLDVSESAEVKLKLLVLDPAASDAAVEELVPQGWEISAVSSGGAVAGQKISWSIAGTLTDQELSYGIRVPEGATDAVFAGSVKIGGATWPIGGRRAFGRGAMKASGFIKHWLLLGPLETRGLWKGNTANPDPYDPVNGPAAAPENGDLRLDFLTDGSLTEKSIRPFDGMRLQPLFGGDGISGAKSLGLEPVARPCAPETPTWESFVCQQGTLKHNEYFGEEIESHVTYSGVYLENTTGSPIQATVEAGSADAFIAFLDGKEILAYEPPPCSGDPSVGCGRWYGAEGTVYESGPVVLPAGESFLLARVHNGYLDSGLRLRFLDQAGSPLLPPRLSAHLDSRARPPSALVRRRLSSRWAGLDPVPVVLDVEVAGRHEVTVEEVLPAGFSAAAISQGGILGAGRITWSLGAIEGPIQLSYSLYPDECAQAAVYCGSTFTVDGAAHAVRGDTAIDREWRGSDDLGAWTSSEVGAAAGGARRIGEREAEVVGSGGGVDLTQRDGLHFVWFRASGDFELSARIDCTIDRGGKGLAGLMVRDTLDPHSAQAFLALSSAPAGGQTSGRSLTGFWRNRTDPARKGAPLAIDSAGQVVNDLPLYLKVKRTGEKLEFFRSADGQDFQEVAEKTIESGMVTRLDLGPDVLLGLAVTGGGAGPALALFREVIGGPPIGVVTSGPQFRRGDVDASGTVNLSDAIRLLNHLFLGKPTPECFDAADFDDNGSANISDAVANLNYLFLAGGPPGAPGPTDCGPDPNLETPDLGCDSPCP